MANSKETLPVVDRRPYQVGDLVVAAGTHPYHDEHRRMGTVGTVVEVHRIPSQDKKDKTWADYIRMWGDLKYADVLIGGEMWSMGPEDIRHAVGA